MWEYVNIDKSIHFHANFDMTLIIIHEINDLKISRRRKKEIGEDKWSKNLKTKNIKSKTTNLILCLKVWNDQGWSYRITI